MVQLLLEVYPPLDLGGGQGMKQLVPARKVTLLQAVVPATKTGSVTPRAHPADLSVVGVPPIHKLQNRDLQVQMYRSALVVAAVSAHA